MPKKKVDEVKMNELNCCKTYQEAFTCDNPECENKTRDWYDDFIKFRTALNNSARASFSRIHPTVKKRIRAEAKKKGVPVLQEWVEALIQFSYEIEDRLGISKEEARMKLPELVDFLEEGLDIDKFF